MSFDTHSIIQLHILSITLCQRVETKYLLRERTFMRLINAESCGVMDSHILCMVKTTCGLLDFLVYFVLEFKT